MTSAPLTGLLASLAWAPIPLALGLLPDSSLNLWPALPLAVAITAFSVALIWMSLRSAIAGVELTPTTLIARGFFVTRRYHREQLRSATSVTLGWWQVFLFGVMRLSPEAEARIVTANGNKRRLSATASSENDVTIGVEIITRWLQSTAPTARRG